jgi:ornithine carbamoyltransferase
MKGLLTLWDLEPSTIQHLIDSSIESKQKLKTQGVDERLKGKTSVLIFEKSSLRTRVTFEVAMTQVGGSTINLEPSSVSIGKRETVEDVAKNLSRWVDVIVARTFSHKLVEELDQYATVPVINALTDKYHPCQALAFAQTLVEKRGSLKGQHLVFVGDGNNVANSLAILAGKMGMDFTLACPKGYEQPDYMTSQLPALFAEYGGKYSVVPSPKEAVSSADVIYTDVWVSMGEEAVAEQKKSDFTGYQVNEELLSVTGDQCLVTHCLPAHRGEEITDGVMDSEACICFDEAENRLHAQKGVLLHLLENK